MTMNTIEIAYSPAERTQRTYARIAGGLFLWLIVTGLAGALTASRIAGSGDFVTTAKRVAASEHLYRIALSSELIETLSAAALAFTLCIALKPFNKQMAQAAMYFRLGEAFIGGAAMIVDFSKLRLYVSPQLLQALGAVQAQAFVNLANDAGFAAYNISAIFFSIGSILFFCVFYESRSIPRILSAWGVFASVVVTFMCFASLIFPEYASALQYGWAPMAIAEVATGIWLMLFAVKIKIPAAAREV